RRFLRFVMPGLVFGTLTIIWVFIVLPQWTIAQIHALGAKDSVGVIVAGVLASGALGYIFATTHHWINWKFDGELLSHLPIVRHLSEKNLIANDAEGLSRERAEI